MFAEVVVGPPRAKLAPVDDLHRAVPAVQDRVQDRSRRHAETDDYHIG
ncbi:hypothetical protein [Actinomadura sp. BRA 177]|nr:hypothetical protein [Actinomadura sp. BRA 177]NVI87572.1 hypothetical protein [Actinomadura sp. BRA 177]